MVPRAVHTSETPNLTLQLEVTRRSSLWAFVTQLAFWTRTLKFNIVTPYGLQIKGGVWFSSCRFIPHDRLKQTNEKNRPESQMVDMKARGMRDVAIHIWIWANGPFSLERRVISHPKTTTEIQTPLGFLEGGKSSTVHSLLANPHVTTAHKTFFTAQQNIASCSASPWTQKLPYLITSSLATSKSGGFFPKPCLKKNPCGLVIFFYTNDNFSSYKDTKLWPFRVGKGEGRIGSKRWQNLKLWFWGHKKTFYKVVVAVCFWTHWNKWHSWFQNWKSQMKFSKREIQIKIFENSLLF